MQVIGDETSINANISIDNNSKKDNIYKIVYNLIPTDKQHKNIQINVIGQ